jgi:hypothetical protein
MAKTPKVRLHIRIRRPDGTDAFVDPAWSRNRTRRAGSALIDGQPEHHVEGIYYLRFLRDGKRVWKAVGSDADAAIPTVLCLRPDRRVGRCEVQRVEEKPAIPSEDRPYPNATRHK